MIMASGMGPGSGRRLVQLHLRLPIVEVVGGAPSEVRGEGPGWPMRTREDQRRSIDDQLKIRFLDNRRAPER